MKTTKHILPLLSRYACLFLLLLTGCSSCSSNAPKEEITPADIDSFEIAIPGISGDYRLLFLTDTHIALPCPAAKEGSSAEIESYSRERLAHFTGESGREASGLFTAWMDYTERESLDGVVLGGDIIDSPSPSNLEFLDKSLGSMKLPYVYTLGNHDWTYPWEYMTEAANTGYLPKLAAYMDGNPAVHSRDFGEFIVAAIDNSSNQVNPAALEDYKSILSQGKPVILLLHVPLYTESVLEKASSVWPGSVILGGGIHGGIYPDETSTEFIRLTTAQDSPVAAVLSGHVHLSDRSYIKGEKDVLQITGDAGYKGKGSILHITGSEQ